MAVMRERPYNQFNFLVDLGTGTTDGPDAGFQEVSRIGMEVTVAEYRNGNEKENGVRKITRNGLSDWNQVIGITKPPRWRSIPLSAHKAMVLPVCS